MKIGRCGLTGKQVPHRPGIAPALGLRAGGYALVIVSETASERRSHHVMEIVSQIEAAEVLKAGVTVFDNGQANTITPGTGQDLIFADVNAGINDVLDTIIGPLPQSDRVIDL